MSEDGSTKSEVRGQKYEVRIRVIQNGKSSRFDASNNRRLIQASDLLLPASYFRLPASLLNAFTEGRVIVNTVPVTISEWTVMVPLWMAIIRLDNASPKPKPFVRVAAGVL